MPKGVYKHTKGINCGIGINKNLFQKGKKNKNWNGFRKGHKRNLGKKRTEEQKKVYSERNKGKKQSEETKKKISETMKGKLNSGQFKKGYKPLSPFQKGDKHLFWQNGKSFEPYTIDWTETLRRSIRERDNYICQLCSQYGNSVHHIDYDKKNCDPKNLITLCRSCNSKVNFNREHWIRYFLNIKSHNNL